MRRPGLWVANGSPSDAGKMLSWKPGALTCFYDYLGLNHVYQYKGEHPEVPIIIRFQHPKNWHEDIDWWAQRQATEVISKWPEIRSLDPYVYFANEMNLHYENGDDNQGNQYNYETPAFYQLYADWVTMTADAIKQRVPEIKLVCPPFAFGHHEDGAPDDIGIPTEGWAGYDYLADTIHTHFNDIICGHYYAGNSGGFVPEWLYDPELSSWYAFRWRRVLKLFERRYGMQVKMIIDEAGTMEASHPDFTDQVIYYTEQCLMDPSILAVCMFLWEDPTYSPGNVMNSWAQQCINLDDHVQQLAGMPDVVIEGEEPVEPVMIRVKLESNKVVRLPLEEYLRGVVPSELGAQWLRMPTDPTRLNVWGENPDPFVLEPTQYEALKWQAVAARTYAMWRINHPRCAEYDILATTSDQVYKVANIHLRSDQAIQDTEGVYLLDAAGAVYQAQYVSGCGLSICSFCEGEGGYKGLKWQGRGCQFGAQRMASQGATWRQIVTRYYPDAHPFDDYEPIGEEAMALFRTYQESNDVLDPNLEKHAWPNGMVTGCVARIVPADVGWQRWGHSDKIIDGSLYWRVRGAKLIDEAQSKGDTNIYVRFLDQQGVPVAAAACWHGYPSSKLSNDNWVGKFDNGGGNGDLFVYATGNGAITQGKNSFLGVEDGAETIGPYCYSGHNHPTEMLVGFGLTNNHHISGTIDFQLAVWGASDPDPDPDPEENKGCLDMFVYLITGRHLA